uniref:Kynurenine 3-monooxygenase n=2 Tax=Rhabditophanes sp. KR3021 TaxID=114890 RepID=A0AC35TMR8_9BILA
MKVIIAGGGLVGALNACFFAERGYTVEVYDIRPDIRQMEHVPGRSINLALSERGKTALERVGLKDYVTHSGVQMHARLVHDMDGKSFHRQPYGQPGQHIISINRRHLNEIMISAAEKFPKIKFMFEHKVVKVDSRKKQLICIDLNSGLEVVSSGDLILACDGAHSAVRRSLIATPHFEYQQEYIKHGYVELNILSKDGDYAMEANVFHLWPRGDFTLIALANRDKTFTVTLFAPFSFFETEMGSNEKIIGTFQKFFPDAYALLGDGHILETFERMKPQPLVSIKCSPHHFGDSVLLMGDAAHSMVPFYGQGMNCGFEDCYVLSEILNECGDDIGGVIKRYSEVRCKDCHTINDLAMYNYNELKDLVNKFSYKLRKKFDLAMNRLFPSSWIPLYSMVSFTTIPYSKIVENRKWQDCMISRSLNVGGMAGVACLAGIICLKYEVIKQFIVRS